MTESDDPRQRMLKSEALAWLTRVSLGEASRDDLAALRQWRDASPAHATALAQAGRLWRELAAPVEALARSGALSVPVRSKAVHRPSRRALLAGGFAAAAAAGGVMAVRPPLGLWPSLAELAADHRTGTGEQRHLTLAGAVSVDLNTQTSIALRTEDQGPGIELISGETAVAVGGSATKPFVVVAAGGRMTASEASFNVRRDGPSVRLTCIDGEVAVECKGRALTLRASQQAIYDGEGLGEVVSIDPATVTAWRDGMLVFRDAPLVRVIEEVNRYRPGRIILLDSALGQRLVTARFEIGRLDTVMGQIGHVFKVPVKRLLGGLVLVG
jgi:transmembrane sensor